MTTVIKQNKTNNFELENNEKPLWEGAAYEVSRTSSHPHRGSYKATEGFFYQ